jgi:hypothetical protein
MALGVPLMSTERVHRELGWAPRHSATDAIAELVAGMRDGAMTTLARTTSGPARVCELITGVGKRQWGAATSRGREPPGKRPCRSDPEG